uniref:Ubinuclein-1 n=1 Tax=Lygus hesperus TaxID=30085 RepID=A0A0A9XLN5_LYGHE
MMNDTKFSRLDPAAAAEPWKKTDPPATAKKEKSMRLTIDIDSGYRGSSGYIFSYEDLVKKARAESEKKSKENKNGGGLPDLMSHESVEEQLKSIASTYEEKYGRGGTGGKRRYQSYADLGAGYDEEDSFIDNTEANEEGIPEEMDTKKGGFYINSGKLELTNRK